MLAPGAAVLRLFNAYGPGQTGTYAGVVSKFIERAKRGLLPVIYGDGTQIRDFIHVADVARFVEVVLDRGAAGVYNVGTGRAVSIRELAAVVMRLAGLGGEPLYGPPRPGDIKHSAAAVSKARALGWQPHAAGGGTEKAMDSNLISSVDCQYELTDIPKFLHAPKSGRKTLLETAPHIQRCHNPPPRLQGPSSTPQNTYATLVILLEIVATLLIAITSATAKNKPHNT